jgi:hypothetical protein
MSAPRQHGLVVLIAIPLLLAACSTETSIEVGGAPAPSVDMPALRLAGLHGGTTALDRATVTGEATHPEALSQELTDAGFVGGAERVLTGRRGVFSRVVLRAWVFSSEEGASAFLDWLRGNAGELIGEAAPLDAAVPAGVDMQLHTPTGCCHEEVPIYLASWQRGATVWTIRASGARIHTAPVVALVRSIAQGG